MDRNICSHKFKKGKMDGYYCCKKITKNGDKNNYFCTKHNKNHVPKKKNIKEKINEIQQNRIFKNNEYKNNNDLIIKKNNNKNKIFKKNIKKRKRIFTCNGGILSFKKIFENIL